MAVKLLDTQHPDRIKSELFRRETAALKLLRHQNVVSLLHSGWSDAAECFYLVLSYLPYSLDGYLNGAGPFKLGHLDQYRIMRELTQALSYAHSMGVVHRDIKPSNILPPGRERTSVVDRLWHKQVAQRSDRWRNSGRILERRVRGAGAEKIGSRRNLV